MEYEIREVLRGENFFKFRGKELEEARRILKKEKFIRGVKGGKEVFVYGNGSNRELFKRLRKIINYGREVKYISPEPLKIEEEKRERLSELKSLFSRIQEVLEDRKEIEVYFYEILKDVKMKSKNGFEGRYIQKYYKFYILLKGEKNGDLIQIGSGRNSKKFSEFEKSYRKFVREYRKLPGRKGLPYKKNILFILSPLSAFSLFDSLIYRFFKGSDVVQKVSFLFDKLNEKIFNEKICILNDPSDEKLTNSRPFDDEGTLTRKFYLVKDGIIGGFLLNRENANILGIKPNGCAYFLPKMGMMWENYHNIKIKGGKDSIKILEDYILLRDSYFDISPSGEFVITCPLAYIFKRGKKMGYVKSFQISGNVFHILSKNLEFISREKENFGNFVVPFIGFKDVKFI